MNRAALLFRLHQHQEAVLAILRGAEPLLIDPALRDTAALARARWALMRTLTAYQLFKHTEIFDPVLAGRLPGGEARATRLKQECQAVADEYRGHLTRWSGADVSGEWAIYQPSALAMTVRLRKHILRERQETEMLLRATAA